MNEKLSQSDLELLSAYHDGELEPAEAQSVRLRVAADPKWAAALAELAALDAALDALTPPPVPPDLAQRIVDRARRERRPRLLLWRYAAPLVTAAAAMVLIAVMIATSGPRAGGPPGAQDVASTTRAQEQQAVEALVVENLPMFAHMDVVENFETLAAIESLEREDVVE